MATARVIRQIMDCVLPGIEFTSETSGDFPGEWGVPTLDTMWRMEGQGVGRSKRINYLFFRKPLSTKLVTPYRSAQSVNGKMASLSQDVFRILSNCSREAEKSDVMGCLEDYCERLRKSGYPMKMAMRIMRNGIMNYERKLEKEIQGRGRIYRHEEEGRSGRRVKKFCGKATWFHAQKGEKNDPSSGENSPLGNWEAR